MRDNYDRLIGELGVSPRGGGGAASRLPRVPQSRMWENGKKAKRATHAGAFYDGPGSPQGGSSAQVSAMLVTRPPYLPTFTHLTYPL